MAHWFHRSPLKATAPATFDLRQVASNAQSQKICSELRQARVRLLEVISNPNNDVATFTKAVEIYFGLLTGIVKSYDADRTGDSKLRHIMKFRWTNTLLGNTPMEQFDSIFEEINMLLNVALWYMKHAAKLAAQDDPKMEEAKEVHKCLRIAAGIFTYVQSSLIGSLIEQPPNGTDLDSRVLNAYISQCCAEAQEVTIARAIELKHAASIVSSLAVETYKLFQAADDALSSLDAKIVTKWRKYLQFKIAVYNAYAYSYHGDSLLAQDKCGEAIKCLQESKKNYEKAAVLSKEYTSAKGTGTTVKPQEHLFFRKLGPVIDRTLDKCVRENGFIYHQKVPPEAPQLELKASYGLAAAEEFVIPTPSLLWTAEAYKGFDITKNNRDNEPKKKEGDEPELKPVKEADVKNSTKDPNNSSGCVVS